MAKRIHKGIRQRYCTTSSIPDNELHRYNNKINNTMKTKQLQLVTFEQAKRLRELGYDWETDSLYFSDDKSSSDDYGLFNHNAIENDSEWTCKVYSAPTVGLALKWFRDTKGLLGCVFFAIEHFRKGYYWNYFSFDNKSVFGKTTDLAGNYEVAESALLNELLTISKETIYEKDNIPR
jgi:hypothetical protein